MPSAKLIPIHPGEILLEDFMKPLEIGVNQLARDLDLPQNHLSAILNGTRAITADTAHRLGTRFHVTPATWLTLQADYDRRIASPQ
jgi:addiction module HigA family antidote